MNIGKDPLLQPLPNQVQEQVWKFVRAQISHYEHRIGARVARYEIHISGSGQIEVEVLSTESAMDAAIDDGLEEAGLKGEVNRMEERERLGDDIAKKE